MHPELFTYFSQRKPLCAQIFDDFHVFQTKLGLPSPWKICALKSRPALLGHVR